MATIKTAIALYDGVTSPLKSMHSAMNLVLNSFESMQRASGKAIDTASIQAAREELARAGTAFDSIEESIRRAENQQDNFNRKMRQGSTAAGDLWGKLKGIAATVGGMAAVKQLVGLSDQMTSNTARLNLIVEDGGSVEALEQKIMASAQRSRAYYLTTARAVSQMGLMAGDAFANNDELIAFTETLNKQFVIAGTNAAGAEAATLQLTQAMASGVLRGEELNSVFEQAPNVIQSIADYLDVPIGKIRDMASEGQITADIVKNAMLSASEEVNAKFESMPMTWGQVWTMVLNVLIQTFDPLIQTVGRGAQFVYDNWAQLEPLFWGLAAAVGAYVLITGAWTAATWLQVAANRALLVSMATNPILWLAIVIGTVVVALYKWVQAVGGLQVAWLICVNNVMTTWDWLQIGFYTGVYWVMDLFDLLVLGIYSTSVSINNYLDDMKTNTLLTLQDMVNGSIGIINDFISKLNHLPGVNLDFVSQVSFGTTAQLENEAKKAARNAELENYREQIESGIAGRDAALEQMKADARAATAQRETEIAAVQAEAAAKNAENLVSTFTPDALAPDAFQLGNTLDNIYSDTGDIAANTRETADAIDLSNEQLELLRDIAEREAINRFTTAEIHVEMNNNNTIAGTQDLDGILAELERKVEEAMVEVSEGVHI